ncbi:hypothetical protein GYMLUDRAFT_262086, partial [Collybiopsis luxurians FD-317 M1]
MPVLECTAKLRTADDKTVFNLTTKHYLEYGDSKKRLKSRFPVNLDVIPASTIVFSLSAVLNRKRLSTEILSQSQLAQLFVQFLRTNAPQLGLNIVSDLYIKDGTSDNLQLNITVNRTRQSFHENVPVRVKLRAIHIQYSVTTEEPSDGDHLFSSRLSLPYRTLAENIFKRFVISHLVKKYPFVFGSLSQQLDVETRYFISIFKSLYEMARRSPNQTFRTKFKQLIKILKRQQQSAYTSSLTSLTSCLQSTDNDLTEPVEEAIQINSETAFCLAMESLFKNGMKKPKFKPVTTSNLIMTSADTQDDDELVVAREYHDPDLLHNHVDGDSEPVNDWEELSPAPKVRSDIVDRYGFLYDEDGASQRPSLPPTNATTHGRSLDLFGDTEDTNLFFSRIFQSGLHGSDSTRNIDGTNLSLSRSENG